MPKKRRKGRGNSNYGRKKMKMEKKMGKRGKD